METNHEQCDSCGTEAKRSELECVDAEFNVYLCEECKRERDEFEQDEMYWFSRGHIGRMA